MSEDTGTNQSAKTDAAAAESSLPKPLVETMRWPFPLIWLVPIAAAIVAGYYLYQAHKDHGPEITIEFADATGVRAGETVVQMAVRRSARSSAWRSARITITHG